MTATETKKQLTQQSRNERRLFHSDRI